MTLQRWSNQFGNAAPSVGFANLPSAASKIEEVYRVTDVGPAPGISLTSNGTIWRPTGGRQVLAMRVLNPVTVQSLSQVVAETIGPFPGGLVRAGMRLHLRLAVKSPAISTSNRLTRILIASPADSTWNAMNVSTSGSNVAGELDTALMVLSDTEALHAGGFPNVNSFLLSSTGLQYSTRANFAADWSVKIALTSAAETAVNITAASWAAGVATFGATAHTLAVGDKTVIAGVTPSGYNIADGGIVTTVPDANTFTIAVAADPGAYTSGGTSSRISNMISQSYVLELIG